MIFSLFHFKPIWQTTGSAIRICHNNIIGSPLPGCWNGEPCGNLCRTIPPDTPRFNYDIRIRALGHFSGEALLETRTNNHHSTRYIVSYRRGRTDAGDSLRIGGDCSACWIGRAPYRKNIGIFHELTIRICDNNVPCTSSCVVRGSKRARYPC